MLHLLVQLEYEIKKDDYHLHYIHLYTDYFTATYNYETAANEEIFEHYQVIHKPLHSPVCYG